MFSMSQMKKRYGSHGYTIGKKRVYARSLTYKAATFKGIISIFLLAFVGFYLYISFDQGVSFECTDPDPNFCTFRFFSMGLSVLLLIPYLAESINIFFIIFTNILETARHSKSNYQVLLSKELTFEGVLYDGNRVYNFLNRRTVLFRVLQSALTGLMFAITFPLGVPLYMMWAFCWGKSEDKEHAVLALILIPEFYVTLLLVPLSIIVINSSGSVTDTLVNLVALQIFSTLDDELVRILLRPKKSVGQLLDNYLNPEYEAEQMDVEGEVATMAEETTLEAV